MSIVILMPFWQSWEVYSLKALTTASVKSKLIIWTWTYPTLTLMLQPRLPFSLSPLKVRMSYLSMMFLATERLLKVRITPVTLTCKRRMSKIPQFNSSFFSLSFFFFFFFFFFLCKDLWRTKFIILFVICIHFPLRAFIFLFVYYFV